MSLRCYRVQALIAKRAQGLDDAERLVLEEHLTGCDVCSVDAALLEHMRAVVREGGGGLSPAARRRILHRALAREVAPRSVQSSARRGRAVLAGAGVAAALACLVAVVRSLPGATPVPMREVVAEGTASAPVPTAAGETRGEAPSPPAPPPGAWFELAPDEVRDAGGVRIEARSGARLRWTSATEALELAFGEVRVDVTPGSGTPLRIAAPRFVVSVLGTSFDLSPEHVSVLRGRVLVLTPQGGDVLAELGAGGVYRAGAPPPARAAAAKDVDGRLDAARRLLASGRPAAARQILDSLPAGSMSRAQQAEARSLVAECALAGGDLDAAARAYGDVAATQGTSLAGETALFAQARTQMRAGHRHAARATFLRYLERFPQGRFRKETLEHLHTLGTSP